MNLQVPAFNPEPTLDQPFEALYRVSGICLGAKYYVLWPEFGASGAKPRIGEERAEAGAFAAPPKRKTLCRSTYLDLCVSCVFMYIHMPFMYLYVYVYSCVNSVLYPCLYLYLYLYMYISVSISTFLCSSMLMSKSGSLFRGL